MYELAEVVERDEATHRVRVRWEDRGGLVSPWLPVIVPCSLEDQAFGLPAVGSQVALLMDERGEAGVVLGAIYSDADPPPDSVGQRRGVVFSDGTLVDYDPSTHVLRVELAPNGEIHLAGSTKKVALAEDVESELADLKSALGSHTHLAGAALVAPGGTVTGSTGGSVDHGYNPGSVGSAAVKSE